MQCAKLHAQCNVGVDSVGVDFVRVDLEGSTRVCVCVCVCVCVQRGLMFMCRTYTCTLQVNALLYTTHCTAGTLPHTCNKQLTSDVVWDTAH